LTTTATYGIDKGDAETTIDAAPIPYHAHLRHDAQFSEPQTSILSASDHPRVKAKAASVVVGVVG
jgi:hypothetical protein